MNRKENKWKPGLQTHETKEGVRRSLFDRFSQGGVRHRRPQALKREWGYGRRESARHPFCRYGIVGTAGGREKWRLEMMKMRNAVCACGCVSACGDPCVLPFPVCPGSAQGFGHSRDKRARTHSYDLARAVSGLERVTKEQ